jgi:hypothetical protein
VVRHDHVGTVAAQSLRIVNAEARSADRLHEAQVKAGAAVQDPLNAQFGRLAAPVEQPHARQDDEAEGQRQDTELGQGDGRADSK